MGQPNPWTTLVPILLRGERELGLLLRGTERSEGRKEGTKREGKEIRFPHVKVGRINTGRGALFRRILSDLVQESKKLSYRRGTALCIVSVEVEVGAITCQYSD